MRTKRSTATANPEFPDECCGVCKFSHKVKNDFRCWVNPPESSDFDDPEVDQVRRRGELVNPNNPVCRDFKARMHA